MPTVRFAILSGRLTLQACVDDLAGVHAFDGDEVFSPLLVFVRIAEGDLG